MPGAWLRVWHTLIKFNSEAHEWLRDSDKQTGMADDCFLQTRFSHFALRVHKEKVSSVSQGSVFETKTLPTFPLFLSEHTYVVWTSSGSSNFQILLDLAGFAITHVAVLRLEFTPIVADYFWY